MAYLNEDQFKELDSFIESCEDKSADIGDLNAVNNAIEELFNIPVRASTVYVGVLCANGAENDLEYYQQCIDQGVELNEEEISQYHELLAAYEEMRKD